MPINKTPNHSSSHCKKDCSLKKVTHIRSKYILKSITKIASNTY